MNDATPLAAADQGSVLAPDARERLESLEQEVRDDPTRIRVRFPAAAREVARTTGAGPDPGAARVEDEVRCRLLEAMAAGLGGDPDAVATEVRDLYRFGDSDERRAVLRSLHRLGVDARAADLVHDGLRTNDPRLVAAALGPYGEAMLDDDAWRQGVLKCLFVGVPVDLVSGLERRADQRLADMVSAYVDERTAAGRAVPEDARRLLGPLTSRET